MKRTHSARPISGVFSPTRRRRPTHTRTLRTTFAPYAAAALNNGPLKRRLRSPEQTEPTRPEEEIRRRWEGGWERGVLPAPPFSSGRSSPTRPEYSWLLFFFSLRLAQAGASLRVRRSGGSAQLSSHARLPISCTRSARDIPRELIRERSPMQLCCNVERALTEFELLFADKPLERKLNSHSNGN